LRPSSVPPEIELVLPPAAFVEGIDEIPFSTALLIVDIHPEVVVPVQIHHFIRRQVAIYQPHMIKR